MGATIRFDTKDVRNKLLRLGRRGKNFDNRLITALLLEFVEDNFDSEGSKGTAGKWSPLKASTIERHPNRSSGALLFNTGLLANFQSVTQDATSIVWSPAPYAKFHVTGTEHMAKRNPFAINRKAFRDEAARLIVLEVVG